MRTQKNDCRGVDSWELARRPWAPQSELFPFVGQPPRNSPKPKTPQAVGAKAIPALRIRISTGRIRIRYGRLPPIPRVWFKHSNILFPLRTSGLTKADGLAR